MSTTKEQRIAELERQVAELEGGPTDGPAFMTPAPYWAENTEEDGAENESSRTVENDGRHFMPTTPYHES